MTGGTSVVDLDLDDVKRGLADGSITLVDVREPHEYTAGHIPGSVSNPLSSFDPDALRDLPGRIVFSCASGVRSLRALEFAQGAGLALNEHYRGGFKEWAMAGEPIE
jgi:rhodanese-related sulfurtransferase